MKREKYIDFKLSQDFIMIVSTDTGNEGTRNDNQRSFKDHRRFDGQSPLLRTDRSDPQNQEKRVGHKGLRRRRYRHDRAGRAL